MAFGFEVYMRAAAGTVYSQLYNLTDGAFVTGSLLSNSGAGDRLRSGAITLVDGKEYTAAFGAEVGAGSGAWKMARLIAI